MLLLRVAPRVHLASSLRGAKRSAQGCTVRYHTGASARCSRRLAALHGLLQRVRREACWRSHGSHVVVGVRQASVRVAAPAGMAEASARCKPRGRRGGGGPVAASASALESSSRRTRHASLSWPSPCRARPHASFDRRQNAGFKLDSARMHSRPAVLVLARQPRARPPPMPPPMPPAS
jgi:hypothetical protein